MPNRNMGAHDISSQASNGSIGLCASRMSFRNLNKKKSYKNLVALFRSSKFTGIDFQENYTFFIQRKNILKKYTDFCEFCCRKSA